ncbi:ion channel protein [Microbacterium sp. C7(2022)]|uniref:ion channel protein n=1 Tax=Microbacterium sp. C7(2022) TaxID=2992759 RepID=UPI00237B83F4|nr:ion channel protein [Microbacterium sp. C7(2022)]MDE0547388.1 ion channel protein [Microbacterium sp. C7(2022)]
MSDETTPARPVPEFGRKNDRAMPADPSPTRRLLMMSVPALLVGIGSALSLVILDLLAEGLDHVLWDLLPESIGFEPMVWWWVIAVLTVAGFATGLLVRFAPGHAGPDPATESFFPHPEKLSVVPGLAAAAIITLATGVSLGPEAPIITINVALAVWVFTKVLPQVPTQLVVLMVVTGTFGALFGSPIGAALLATSVAASVASKELLWDRLFLPLASAASGSIVMMLLSSHSMSLDVPESEMNVLVHLGVGVVVLALGIGVGLVLLGIFPTVHRLFHRWRGPVLPLTIAGLMLGVLGAIGGEVTMFKGLSQMQELVAEADNLTPWQLAGIVLIKVAALAIAGAAGFRGGRVFPTVFIGAAIGILAYAVFPEIPLATAIGAGVLGICLVVVRDGWLSLFIAGVVVGDATLIPILCMLVLPGWLAVARLPQMRITPPAVAAAASSEPSKPSAPPAPSGPTEPSAPSGPSNPA